MTMLVQWLLVTVVIEDGSDGMAVKHHHNGNYRIQWSLFEFRQSQPAIEFGCRIVKFERCGFLP